jgi:FPC/CPF motif-containing protein YcgG
MPNPFTDPLALAHCNAWAFDGRRLTRDDGSRAPSALTSFVHDNFRALVLNERFSCVAAKAALRQHGYRFALYGDLGADDACAGLSHDLYAFCDERREIETDFHTFVASFAGPTPMDEEHFERLLWSTLQRLNDLDAAHHEWDAEAAADPSSTRFAFSFARTAFFVVGLHAASSRATRRFAWPTLVFNAHDQFDRLKTSGRYSRFQQVIRTAERELQGDVNPMLADFGERSEAAQYSGRNVEPGWRCPFHANRAADAGRPAQEETPHEPSSD